MDQQSSIPESNRKRQNATLIVRRAASKRLAINEYQAQHLCALARRMVQAAMEQSKVRDVADLPEEGWDTFTELPEYEMFTLGAYACGFVCADLSPDADVNAVMSRPRDALREMSLPRIRHFIHTLMRAERAGYGFGSVIFTALRSGVFEALCARLEGGTDLYESL